MDKQDPDLEIVAMIPLSEFQQAVVTEGVLRERGGKRKLDLSNNKSMQLVSQRHGMENSFGIS